MRRTPEGLVVLTEQDLLPDRVAHTRSDKHLSAKTVEKLKDDTQRLAAEMLGDKANSPSIPEHF